MCIQVFAVLVGLATQCSAGYAPSKAPDLPKEWCSEKEGVVTVSTGECMCRYKCEGKTCQSGQGMIWYSYNDCPTGCKCLPRQEQKVVAPEEHHSFSTSQGTKVTQCSEDKPACGDDDSFDKPAISGKAANTASMHDKPTGRKSVPEEYGNEYNYDVDESGDWSQPTQNDGESEEPTSALEAVMEWLDEYHRHLFGGIVVLMLLCLLLPSLIFVGLGASQLPPDDTTDKQAKKTLAATVTSQPKGPASKTD